MLQMPQIKITATVLQLLAQIEAQKHVYKSSNFSAVLVRAHANKTILKSALYSAKIEGNTLSIDDLELSDDEAQKLEVFNLQDASQYITQLPSKTPVTLDLVRHIHAIVMRGLAPDAGHLRKTQNAIFNAAGVAVYLPPPATQMRQDLERLLHDISCPAEFPILTALLAHLVFEKIHPFIDGNGRVGRLFVSLVMQEHGFSWPFPLPFEQSLYVKRDAYYRMLDLGMKYPHDYLCFMLECLLQELQDSNKEIIKMQSISQDEKLFALPARALEILSIIRDLRLVSVDMLARRFAKVPPRTIRGDIARLLKLKLITKVGTTRGAYYKKL